MQDCDACERVLFTREEIQREVAALARRIEADYQDKNLLAVCVLKGAVIFFSELILQVRLPLRMDVIKVSSYGNSARPGELKIDFSLQAAEGKDVLLVEDVVDSGRTLCMLKEELLSRGARSVRIAALLDKPVNRKVALQADYRCFEAGDEFVVGYGMDYAERYRNLPYIGVLKREIYEK